MKSKTLLALAVAGAVTCSTGALAGSSWNGYEVRTPSSVDESAPWLANESHVPASASSMTFASTSGDLGAMDSPLASNAHSNVSATNTAYTEYWLLGADGSDIGASSGLSGMGSVAFDSSMSSGELASYSFEPAASAFEMVLFTPTAVDVIHDVGHTTPLLSEHFLIPMPESAYDPSQVVVLMIGPGSEDIALLDALKEHFVVLTPDYGQV
jgi:hypothetical protein